MRTLNYQSAVKQQEIARETMEIFAPLAHRLGIFRFKWELEDLAFAYLNSDMYYEIAKRYKTKAREREEYVHELIEQIRSGLEQIGIGADIAGRPKNIYSIYRKMIKQGKDIDEIYDKIAIRVIVNEVPECYGVLGIIHTMWRPCRGGSRIISPPPSTTCTSRCILRFWAKGVNPLRCRFAPGRCTSSSEYGIAAHWRYKEESAPGRRILMRSWPGCGKCWSGSRKSKIIVNS
jgi:GTP pyrophosphokinase